MFIGNSERNKGPKSGRPCEERIVANGKARIAVWRRQVLGVAVEVERRCRSGRGCDLTVDDFGV